MLVILKKAGTSTHRIHSKFHILPNHSNLFSNLFNEDVLGKWEQNFERDRDALLARVIYNQLNFQRTCHAGSITNEARTIVRLNEKLTRATIQLNTKQQYKAIVKQENSKK